MNRAHKKYLSLLACPGMIALWAFPAAAAEWQVIPDQSKLMFSATQAGTAFEGQFKKFDATIIFDPDHLESSKVTVTIHMATVATDNGDRDALLAGSLWFDIARFPTAEFTADRFMRKGPDAYEAAGRLTLHGVSRQLRLPFTLVIKEGKAHAIGHLTLSRRDYGVGSGEWASDKWVGYKVAVTFDLNAVAK